PPVSPGAGMDDVASSPLITVIASFHGSRGFNVNGNSVSSPGFIAQCAGSQPCGLKIPTNLGIFPLASAFAEGTMAGNMDSRSGSANVTPAPRKKVRRGICFFSMNIAIRLSGNSGTGDSHKEAQKSQSENSCVTFVPFCGYFLSSNYLRFI